MATSHQALKAEPNLTPILDMVFQLITFFMLVVNFKTASLDASIQLPVLGSALPTESEDRDVLVLNVIDDGKVRVYGEIRDVEACVTEEARLAKQHGGGTKLATIRSGDELPTTVIIRASHDAPYHWVHQAIQACQKHGFRNFQYRAVNAGG